ncbi:hypothetical protein [Rhodoligotrophos ferricapiens]|uniref:hypothetical protein n=1 Tax=Rhodoligotrophos ferricapiens TaxID=3069264 RepID=UPI00315CBA75
MQAASQYIRFSSSDLLNHLPRVLAILERMGFVLEAMSVNRADEDRSKVMLMYKPNGQLSCDTFIARLATLPGIEDLSQGREHGG